MSTREIGIAGERQAENYLHARGFNTVARNYRAKTGEIDLIMNQDDLLVFVEVRLRTNPNHGSPAATVTRSKQRKITRTAEHFLIQNTSANWKRFRFDVIGIGESMDWIPGAFTLD